MEPVKRRPVTRIKGGVASMTEDAITAEEPLEIRLNDAPLAVVMRTPGDDIALAAGFVLTEGILPDPEAVGSIAHCRETRAGAEGNIVNVIASEGIVVDPERFKRNFYASSSCGLCGKASIEAVMLGAPPVGPSRNIAPGLLLRIMAELGKGQKVFAETGSLHAAALFARDGTPGALAEDVGRHNAVDKVIGRAALAGNWPLSHSILCVSGRISFEITQKAAMAGIPVIAAVSGASSLSVELASELGMSLAGFVRGDSMTVYCGDVG